MKYCKRGIYTGIIIAILFGILLFNIAKADSGTLSISIWDSSNNSINIYVKDYASFYANLTDDNMAAVSTADCNIEIDSNSYPMSYSNNLYIYTKQINTSGTYAYNISCTNSTYEISLNDTLTVQDIPQCGEDISWILSPSAPHCGVNFEARISDSTDPVCRATSTCFDNYDNATIVLSDGYSISEDLNLTLANDDGSLIKWTLKCTALSNATINVTLANSSNKCMKNISYEFNQWNTLPSLNITFPETFPTLRINHTYYFNITYNNTGDDNATDIHHRLFASNLSIINLNISYIVSLVENGTSVNYTFSITPNASGNFSLYLNETGYYNTFNAFIRTLSSINTSSIHVNYYPAVSFPNISLLWNSSNATINLSNAAFYSDEDHYDNYSNVNITWSGNENISINLTSSYILNFSHVNNFTGSNNITFLINDTLNDSTLEIITVFVSNGTTELCNNIDDDQDTLVDEGTIIAQCCDYTQCTQYGNKTCLGAGIWGE